VSFLVACYSVVAGSDGLLSLYFSGTNGSNAISDSVTDMGVPDFSDVNGATINQSYTAADGGNVLDQTVFEVDNVGAGGTGNSATGGLHDYALTEITVNLGPAFNSGTLTNITFYQNAYNPILLGITAQTGSASPTPEPSTWGLLLSGLALSGAGLTRGRNRRGRRGA
jgi:hypothetical protein